MQPDSAAPDGAAPAARPRTARSRRRGPGGASRRGIGERVGGAARPCGALINSSAAPGAVGDTGRSPGSDHPAGLVTHCVGRCGPCGAARAGHRRTRRVARHGPCGALIESSAAPGAVAGTGRSPGSDHLAGVVAQSSAGAGGRRRAATSADVGHVRPRPPPRPRPPSSATASHRFWVNRTRLDLCENPRTCAVVPGDRAARRWGRSGGAAGSGGSRGRCGGEPVRAGDEVTASRRRRGRSRCPARPR